MKTPLVDELKDNEVEENLLSILKRFNIFSELENLHVLQNIATKDLATTKIQDSLLNAVQLGQKQLNSFVAERKIMCPERRRR